MRPPSRWSIRALLVALVSVSVVPLTGLAAYFGYRDYQADRDLAEEGMRASAEAATSGVHRFLRDSEHLVAGLAGDEEVRSLDPADCDRLQHLRSLVEPTFTNMATWTTDGRPVCSLLPSPDGLEMADAPGFADAMRADGFFVTPVQVGRRSNRWTTQFTYPLRDDQGNKRGIVAVGVDLVRFERILQTLNMRGHAVLTLLEPDGRVVARTLNSRETVGKRIPDTRFARVVAGELPKRDLLRAPSMEGEDYTFAYVLIDGVNWIATAGRPSREIYGPSRERLIQLILLSVSVILVAFLAMRLVYGRITVPIQGLLLGISSARPGEPADLSADGPREVAWVADRFNQAWGAWAAAEKDRRRAAERVHSLVDNAVTGIYVSTEDDQFLEVNQAMVDLLGYDSREELLDTPVHVMYGSDEIRRRYMHEYGRLESFRGAPAEWQRKDGGTVQVRLSGRRMTLEDGRQAWEIVVDDVTEITRLQAQYLQAQKMEALGRLAGGIAHDFNNILTVVQGQADLLKDDPGLSEDYRAELAEIHDAAVRGAALNRQLLAFGRRSPTEKRATDLNEVVDGVEIMLGRMVGEDVDLRLDLGDGLGMVRVNPSQIEQVVMNLCVNARDAMPEGGAITVRTYRTQVDAEDARIHADATEGPHVVLSVQDTGQGIPAEVLPHVFEPFFTTKPTSKGTGLGLSTVYGIVTDAGGHLRVESVQGQGTTFSAFLPVDDSDAPEEPAEAAEPARQKSSGVVLVAEDEPGVRRLAVRILERAGYAVLTAADGPAALRAAEEYDGVIDALLTDVVMPGLGGQGLAEELARRGRVRRAVLFSGYPEGMSEHGPAALTAWRFLPKPFTGTALLRAVEEVLAAG